MRAQSRGERPGWRDTVLEVDFWGFDVWVWGRERVEVPGPRVEGCCWGRGRDWGRGRRVGGRDDGVGRGGGGMIDNEEGGSEGPAFGVVASSSGSELDVVEMVGADGIGGEGGDIDALSAWAFALAMVGPSGIVDGSGILAWPPPSSRVPCAGLRSGCSVRGCRQESR